MLRDIRQRYDGASSLSRSSRTGLVPLIPRATRLLLLAACSTLAACGSPGGQAPRTGATASPGPSPPAEGVSWGFFDYTTDFASGLNNARWGRATGNVWSAIERPPGSGNYDWSALDTRVRNAQAAGISAVVVLKTGNGAAFSEPDCFRRVDAAPEDSFSNGRALSSCPIKREMESAWARLVTQFVERYDGDGQGDMPGWTGNIRVDIQVENEAANSELWDYGETDRTASADRYLRLLEISHQAKQAANPATQLILGGLIHPNLLARCDGQPSRPACGALTVQRNLAFTRRILARPDLFDAVDVHVFVYHRFEPQYIDDGLQWLASQMQQRGYQRPVYSLEWTGAMMLHVATEGYADEFAGYFPYSAEFPSRAAFQAMYAALDQPQHVTYREWFEAEQAEEFAKLFTNMLALGVSRLVHVQYSDYRPGNWDNVWWNWQGIIKYVGGTPIRKPSYYTYNLLSERLSGFTGARRIGQGGGVRLYEFTFPSREPTYVLWTDGADGILDLSRVIPQGNVRVTGLVTEIDAADRPVVPPEQTVAATAVPVGDVPVLLQGAP